MTPPRRPLPWPLRLRLTLWYTAALGLVLLLFAALLYYQVGRSLLAQVDAGLDIAATQALLAVRAEGERLTFRDPAADASLAGQLRDDFLVVNLLAPDGRVWARLGEPDEVPPPATLAAGHATVIADGEPRRVAYRPVAIGGVAGWLQVVQDLDAVNEPLAALRRQMLIALPVALLAAALGGTFVAGRALRPIEQLTQTARAIHADDLGRRVGYAGPPDEVGRLAATLDDMLARLEEGFARERRFTADAAHELRTPLAALKGRIGVTLSRPRLPAAYVAALTEMEGQVDRLSRLSDDLLLLARLPAGGHPPAWEAIRLADFLPAVLDVVRPLAEAKGIALTLDAPDELVVHGRLDWLTRLLLNLLDNAVKYTPPGGRVSLAATRGAGWVAIAVGDSGPGIAPEHLPHLFERFYRVAGDRARADGGAGLGLALAQEIARAHRGSLTVASAIGRGSVFTVRLPDS